MPKDVPIAARKAAVSNFGSIWLVIVSRKFSNPFFPVPSALRNSPEAVAEYGHVPASIRSDQFASDVRSR